MRRQFFKSLETSLGTRNIQLPAKYKVAILCATSQLVKDNLTSAQGEAEKFHLELASLVYETFKFLVAYGVERSDIDDALMLAVTTPNRRIIRLGVKFKLASSRDPMRSLVEYSKNRIPLIYGKGFSFEEEGNDESSYTMHVTHCFYHQFFVVKGEPELTRFFCEWDKNWIEPISEKQHNVRFSRVTTIAKGGSTCPFQFERLTK